MYFDTILIANRGEIAVRIIRSCRELGIAAAAVYSDADRAALHVRQADRACPIGPAAAAESYLSVERIIAAAQQSGAQAIHPGYGFLSERAALALACREAGLTFIGPPPEAIALMGSKIDAKRLAESVGVPTVPGYMGADQRPEVLLAEAERIGFPLLIKASAGGGGKGMRVVERGDEFAAALAAAQREARAAFGDDAVFLERLIRRPRHIEIQVLADAYGGCVHLFERECSIQRRHQKIVEESPALALTPELRAAMGADAVRLALAAGYRNAGTVEFMLDQAGRYYFLEMNTRLQVEHPVTELVAGVDLVRLQIALAAGERLPFSQADLAQRGHAIELRVYAEEPDSYLPTSGQIALFAPAEGPGIRNDAGVASGDSVGIHYDPLLAKLIVHATDRLAALARLRAALGSYTLLGITSNLPLLRAIAEHPDFAAGATHTDFLATSGLAARSFARPTPDEVLVAAALGEQQRPARDPWAAGPWRLLREGARVRYRDNAGEHLLKLSQSGGRWQVATPTATYRVTVLDWQPSWLTLQFDDARVERFAYAERDGERLVGWRGESYWLCVAGGLSVDSLAGHTGGAIGHASLLAPMPGSVLKILVTEGQEVAIHQPLVILEAMKMEHVVAAPYAGIVRQILCSNGQMVSKSAALVELDEV